LLAVVDDRLEHQAALLVEVAGEHLVQAAQHLARRDVGEKAEAAAVDAQQRHVAARDQPGGVQHRAVAADGHHQVGAAASSASGRTPPSMPGNSMRISGSSTTRTPLAARWRARISMESPTRGSRYLPVRAMVLKLRLIAASGGARGRSL
jgi:hypothetical protein